MSKFRKQTATTTKYNKQQLHLLGGSGGEEASMRTSEAHGHTESLRRAHRNVEAHLTHRLEENRGHQVRAAHHHRTVRVRLGGEIRPVLHTT